MDLDKYKQGKLSEEELDLFTGELVRAKFNQAQKEKWTKKLATEHKIERTKPKVKFFQLHFRKLAIAASFLFLLSLLPFLQDYLQPEAQRLANNYLENRLSLPDNKRSTTSIEIADLKKQAKNAYNNQDYETASQIYEKVLNSNAVENEDFLFAGLSYLYEGKSAKAVEKLVLAQAKIAQGEKFWEETNWFLSLAYLKNKDLIKARQQLTQIIQTDGFYSDKAQKILLTL
ncbi:MAG: hypothetical protein AB8G86_02950 [Saprospiraceae bacterium]